MRTRGCGVIVKHTQKATKLDSCSELHHLCPFSVHDAQQRVKARCDTEGPRAAARLLLACLKRKRHWFQALMQALDCRYLKLQDFRPKFLQLKGQLLQSERQRVLVVLVRHYIVVTMLLLQCRLSLGQRHCSPEQCCFYSVD